MLIIYEYPFNERIRTLLRLKDLHKKFVFFLHQESALQHHVALSIIFEILEVIGRTDFKLDVLQELERQKHILLTYKSNPNVEQKALNDILTEINRVSTTLSKIPGRAGQDIRENEWLMSIRSRTIIPGGACEFDLPSYFAWQQHTPKKRFTDISNWFASLTPLFDAIIILIQLLQKSGHPVKIHTENGNYQQMLQGKIYQMLRLIIDQQLGAIPEISANKYMLWIRFTSQDGNLKPKAYDGEVSFELTLCGF